MANSDASNLVIRDSEQDDMIEIRNIYDYHVHHGSATFDEETPSLEYLCDNRKTLKEGNFPHIVAVSDGKVVGYAYSAPYRLRSAYRFTVEDSIYLRNGYERKGIGKALLKELIKRSVERGYRQMIAVIGDSDNAGSIGLHTHMGFQMVGTLQSVGFKFGRWVDVVQMQLDLTQLSSS
eukprot:TRINITY_DN5178_c0_g1_i1.p1 TRINITY_DN5178_c0_g1~~TRINITY_DN5178_c0_g1_i1.p1  ORF type:complete len:189 (+),score=46.60 TRINITY_DN5178_c0_g1_i1:35-568(+)